MNIKGKLFKIGILYTLFNLLDKGLNFLIIPILTRQMAIREYGELSVYQAWVTLLPVFLGLSIWGTYKIMQTRLNPEERTKYINSMLWLVVLVYGVVLFLLVLLKLFISINSLTILALIHSLMATLIYIKRDYYMMEVNIVKRVAVTNIPNVLINVLTLLLIFSINNSAFNIRIFLLVGINLIYGLIILLSSLIENNFKVETKYWKEGLNYSIPLIFHGVSMVILSISDRFMLKHYLTSKEVGIYSLAYTIGMMPNIIVTPFENIWIPYFTKNLKASNEKLINSMMGKYIYIVSCIIGGMMVISPFTLRILGGEKYLGSTNLLPILLLSYYVIFTYSLAVNIEYYYGSTKSIAKNTSIAAILNIFLNLLFIPRLGILGAAITTLVSYLVSLIFHVKDAENLNKKISLKGSLIMPYIFMTLTTLNCLYNNGLVFKFMIEGLLILIYTYFIFKRSKNERNNIGRWLRNKALPDNKGNFKTN